MGLLKSLILPPAALVILILVGLLLRRRWPVVGRTCVLVGAALLFMLSLPAVGTSLLMLHQDYPPISPETLVSASAGPAAPGAIVVLGADFRGSSPEYGTPQPTETTFDRLRYAAFLQRKTGLALLVSAGNKVNDEMRGGSVMKLTLESVLGAEVAYVEEASRTTWENAALSATLLKQAGIESIYLVTHAWHMPRAKRAFERHGMAVTPAPTAFATAPTLSVFDWLPSAAALRSSYLSFHEALGRIAYRFR